MKTNLNPKPTFPLVFGLQNDPSAAAQRQGFEAYLKRLVFLQLTPPQAKLFNSLPYDSRRNLEPQWLEYATFLTCSALQSKQFRQELTTSLQEAYSDYLNRNSN